MLTFTRLFTAAVTLVAQVVRALFRSRSNLVLENLALRQQLRRDNPNQIRKDRPGAKNSDNSHLPHSYREVLS